jgi:hypothetical protein
MTLAVKDMELRDWFAGMALQALLTVPNTWPASGTPRAPNKSIADTAAHKAYQVADAMMAARQKTSGKR